MLIIPISTDAPIYHGPWATIAMIVANVIIAIAFGTAGIEHRAEWGLYYGTGLHPVQWLTSNFIHADIGHLVGNMIFLMAFGLVVEGKVGWLRFLAIYVGIGMAHAALQQMFMAPDMPSVSFGASSPIFGLLAICMIWAPRNEMTCLYWFCYRYGEREFSLQTLASIYLGLAIVDAWWKGESVSTPMLHLSGAFVGLIVGAAMVKLHWVDCENWDLFAVMAGREGEEAPRKKPKKKAIRKEPKADPTLALKAVEHFLEEGNPTAAAKAYEELQAKQGQAELSETLLGKLIKALNDEQKWEASAPRMVEFVKRFPEKADRMRLKLAQVYVDQLNRPYRAQAVLREVEPDSLSEPLQKAKRALEKKVAQAIEEAPLELEGAE